MNRRQDVDRTEYYRQEASACARAALTTAIPDIKQAYTELEQGWLCLAPKPKESLDGSPEAEPARGAEQGADRLLPEKTQSANERGACAGRGA